MLFLTLLLVGFSTQGPLPPIPGLSTSGPDGIVFSRGFDAKFGTAALPVVDFSYDGFYGSNVWVDPETGQSFHKPDQLDVLNTPSETVKTDTHIFYNYSDYQKHEWDSHHFGIGAFVFSFGYTQAAGYMKDIMHGHKTVVFASSRDVVTTKLELWTPQIIQYMMKYGNQSDTAFSVQQKNLPPNREGSANSAAYDAFIQTFGSHYADSAYLGGRLQYMLAVESDLFSTYTTKWVYQQVSLAFTIYDVAFGFNEATNKSSGSLHSDFIEKSKMVLFAFGGDVTQIDDGNYKNWAASVPLCPVPLNATLQEIDKIMLDSSKASVMEGAVKEYLNTPVDKPPVCGDIPGVVPSFYPKTKDRMLRGKPIARRVDAPLLSACEPQNLVPGTGIGGAVGKTFNMKTGDLGFAVLEPSCNKGNQVHFLPVNKWWQVPDGVAIIQTPSACFAENEWSISSKTDAWKAEVSSIGGSIGFGYDDITVGISLEREMGKFNSLTTGYTKSATILHRGFTLYRLQADVAQQSLDPMFLRAVSMLPKAYSAETYHGFVSEWGTHFVSSVDLGGYCNFTVLVNKSMSAHKSSEWTSWQVGLQIGFLLEGIGINIDLGYNTTMEKGKLDEEFESNSHATFSCVGGDVALLVDSADYAKWKHTIWEAPEPVPHSQQLRPLSELVADPTVAGNLHTAILEVLNAE